MGRKRLIQRWVLALLLLAVALVSPLGEVFPPAASSRAVASVEPLSGEHQLSPGAPVDPGTGGGGIGGTLPGSGPSDPGNSSPAEAEPAKPWWQRFGEWLNDQVAEAKEALAPVGKAISQGWERFKDFSGQTWESFVDWSRQHADQIQGAAKGVGAALVVIGVALVVAAAFALSPVIVAGAVVGALAFGIAYGWTVGSAKFNYWDALLISGFGAIVGGFLASGSSLSTLWTQGLKSIGGWSGFLKAGWGAFKSATLFQASIDAYNFLAHGKTPDWRDYATLAIFSFTLAPILKVLVAGMAPSTRRAGQAWLDRRLFGSPNWSLRAGIRWLRQGISRLARTNRLFGFLYNAGRKRDPWYKRWTVGFIGKGLRAFRARLSYGKGAKGLVWDVLAGPVVVKTSGAFKSWVQKLIKPPDPNAPKQPWWYRWLAKTGADKIAK